MHTFVIATSNSGKLKEIKQALHDLPIQFKSQADFAIPEIEETGLTFVENALIKARHVASHTHLPTIADDSGLVVQALQGNPGIYSARYAGINSSNQENIQKLLVNLQNVPEDQRTAYFHCTLVVLRHEFDPMPIICQGVWEGRILTEPRGSHGFGYDPIFYDIHKQKAAAELTLAEKNKISHRGLALHCLRQQLQKLIKVGI